MARVSSYVATLALGALLLACGGGSGSQPPADSFLITTLSGGVDRLDLPSGDETPVLSFKDASAIDVTVAPDGKRIAFVHAPDITTTTTDFGSDIYVANLDGSAPQPLIEHAVQSELLRWPIWLPDGDTMIIQVQSPGVPSAHLEKVDLTTGERTMFAEDALSPTLSEDGETLAYVTNDLDTGEQAIWISDPSGESKQQVVGSSADLSFFGYVAIAPDGSRLVFGAAKPLSAQARPTRAELVGETVGPRVPDITHVLTDGLPEDAWIVNRDGSGLRNLSAIAEDQPSFAWSSDGNWIYSMGSKALLRIDATNGDRKKIGEGVVHGEIVRLPAP